MTEEHTANCSDRSDRQAAGSNDATESEDQRGVQTLEWASLTLNGCPWSTNGSFALVERRVLREALDFD